MDVSPIVYEVARFMWWLIVITVPVCGVLLWGLAVVAHRMDANHVQLGKLNGTWDDAE